VPAILRVEEEVLIQRGLHEGPLGELVARLLDEGLREVGHSNKVFFLSAPDDLEHTIKLDQPVENDLPTGFTQGQRYVSLAELRKAKRTSELVKNAGEEAKDETRAEGESLTFNSLLREAGFSPGDFRLIRHADNRADRGRSPYDLWRDNRPQFEWYQSTQAIDNRKKLTAPYWAVFLGTPSGETMFVGIYSVKYQGLLKEDSEKPHVKGEVDKAGSCDVYELTLQPALGDLIGKLFISWGPGALAWVQYADRQEKPIKDPRSQDDTGDTSETEPDRPNEPWNGEFYCNFNDGENRSWADAVAYGFISAGGGAWYSRTLQLLNPGDRVWVNVPGRGFVGVGRVTGRAEPVSSFKVRTPEGEVPVLQAAKRTHHDKFLDDPENCEYFVPVRWLQTVPLEQAVNEVGFFGNQNTVCKPTALKWRTTVEKLKEKFSNYNK